MKIAHLSDLHICSKSRPNNLIFTRKLIQYALEQGVDHMVVTGDLIHLANADDFIALRNLFKEFELLDYSKLSLVLGNHDIFGGVHLAEDILAFPAKCEAIDYNQKVKEFKNYFLEVFENSYYPLPNEVLLYAKPIANVVFIGINSIAQYSKLKNPFASTGKVEKNQVTGIEDILKNQSFKNKRKIVLIHHHFKKHKGHFFNNGNSILYNIEREANKLRKKNRLLKLFQKHDVELILHGHEHESLDYWLKGLHFLNAGGCIDKNKPGELKLNLITINSKTIESEVRIIPDSDIKPIPKKTSIKTLVLN